MKEKIAQINNLNHLKEIFEISNKQFQGCGWSIKCFEKEIKNPQHFSYFCFNESDIVAFIFFMKTEGEKVLDYNITNLACDEKFKRLGYATKLIKFCIEHAKNNNIKKVWLEVCENNLPAINFYQKLGFKLDYVRKNYYANHKNALIMSRWLEENSST